MQIVHRGFDTIALSIQANIPPELFDYLDGEREKAEEARAPVPVSYGGVEFDLLHHGGNGYRFILKGGPLDMTWFFKKPNARDPWGIRLSVGSTLLATQGLGYARAQIDKTLDRLGIRHGAHQVSIGRADFCVDILAPEFELVPENFVIHSHANRADQLIASEDVRSNGKSGRFTSVTVGKMPGRQIILYDKRREVIDRRKTIWWDIWNANLARDGLPPLNPEDRTQSQVWRIEVRAGKDHLKDRWQIRQWAEFDALFGDVVARTLAQVRYSQPDPTDSNRARWPNHPIWDMAAAECEGDLTEMRSHVDPDSVRYVHRAEHIRLIMAQLTGNATTLAALEGVPEPELSDHMERLGARLADAIRADPERAANKLTEAKARYRFTE
ncbi:hypothetical protein SAMN05444722_0029 [Rhodovulum sp. ES.010]|uniref:hypothetical protein n=1 Tax=Rhodovulum sp. ES.010 TaxID=1882821 RepID=UPI000927CCFE|nr:hypothetical protein [Rhodovulum sp. ES.010]SIN99001.1 hypothetical protein SAMN05444722_0029 [Rhodovulum sp. ES.010]